ncbi:MAG TPA: hypothetical protein VGS21_07260 [Acidimicrobiales bacterium]|nr:hypothetical protein [Acidimicrobiales bacterium]
MARARLVGELRVREAWLRMLAAEVASNRDFRSADRTVLENMLRTEAIGIRQLEARAVTAGNNMTTVRTETGSMFNDFHVFFVMTPQVQVATTAANLEGIDKGLARLEPALARLISHSRTTVSSDGEGRSSEGEGTRTAFREYKKEVALAGRDARMAMTGVLGTTPAQFPGNVRVFVAAESMLQTSRQEIALARSDLFTILRDLLNHTR